MFLREDGAMPGTTSPSDDPFRGGDVVGGMLRDYLNLGTVGHTNAADGRRIWPRLAGGYQPARVPPAWMRATGRARFPMSRGNRWR
jgi:hypothetical protein